MIKAYYFQVSATTSRSQHHCTTATERNEAPDDVSSRRKKGLFPSFLYLCSESEETCIIHLFFFSNAAWLSVKNRRPDFRTTHRLLLWSLPAGTREEERGALTYWKPRPQTLPKDLYISQKDRTHHRCRLQPSYVTQNGMLTRFHPDEEQLRVLRAFSIVFLCVLTHVLMFDLTVVGKISEAPVYRWRCKKNPQKLQHHPGEIYFLSTRHKETGRRGNKSSNGNPSVITFDLWPEQSWIRGWTFRHMTDTHIPFPDRNTPTLLAARRGSLSRLKIDDTAQSKYQDVWKNPPPPHTGATDG